MLQTDVGAKADRGEMMGLLDRKIDLEVVEHELSKVCVRVRVCACVCVCVCAGPPGCFPGCGGRLSLSLSLSLPLNQRGLAAMY